MDTDFSALTLQLILTAAGATVTAGLITGIVQLAKTLFGSHWPGAGVSRGLAFVLSIVFVAWAYVGIPVEITAATLFAGLIAVYGIARLAMAVYDDVAQKPGSLTGPPA